MSDLIVLIYLYDYLLTKFLNLRKALKASALNYSSLNLRFLVVESRKNIIYLLF